MRTTSLFLLGLMALGCGDDGGGGGDSAPDTTDATADSEVSPDTTPDTAVDTATTPDVGPDSGPPEVVPDTTDTTDIADTADTAPETDDDTVGPGELAIAMGDRCSALTELESPSLPFTDAGDTTAAADDYIYTTGAACGGVGQGVLGDASPDLVYAFSPAISATYRIELVPDGDFDPGLMVTDACPPIGEDGFSALTCVGVSDQGKGAPEILSVELVAGVRYFVLVDGWSNDEPVGGAFSLSIDIGEDCDDGADNNGDGLADCADPQCVSDPRCDESIYQDGCANDDDDDGDGATDCADPDCDGSSLCNEATAGACDNGIDDEGDGATDCADPDCGGLPSCDEATYEAGCDNSADDDGDGRTDCEDPDCGFASACLVIGETCETAPELTLNVPARGTTNGRQNDYGSSVATCTLSTGFSDSFGLGAPDAAYLFTPPASGKYVFETDSDFDDALTVTTDCAFSPGSLCFGVERSGSGGERVIVDLAAGAPVYVIVDGWSNTSDTNTGEFTLSVRRATSDNAELVCNDGADGDLDGDADCADVDCAFDRDYCVEIGNCDDTVDNDGDGDVDCDDGDCRGDLVACPPPPGDNCAEPAMIDALAEALVFDTCDFGVDFMFAPDAGCVLPTFDSPDGVIGFVAPAAGQYVAELSSIEMDSILSAVVADACPAPAIAACDASDDALDTQRVSLALEAGQTAWLLVSAYGDDWAEEPGCGEASLTVHQVEPETCDDEDDNDRDGDADCDDGDCALAPNCNEAQNGDDACNDGEDDDGDLVIDCFDIDCAGSAACPNGIPGDGCAYPLEASGALWKQIVESCVYTNDFTAQESGGCQSSSGTPKDVLVKYQVGESGDYGIQFDPGVAGGTSFDALLNVVEGASCPTSPLTSCVASADSGDPETASVTAAAGDTLWIVGGGWGSGCGRSELAVWKTGPEVCDDGVDNDVNGQRDCRDAACADAAECVEVCDDKTDNDDDGKIDCADSGCDSSALCNEALNGDDACGNGLDDDDDGAADCYDADCRDAAACPDGTIGDSCGAAPLIDTESWTGTFATCDYVNDYEQFSNASCRTMGTAGDVVAHLVAPSAGDYLVSYTSGLASTPAFDSVINVVAGDACPSGEVTSCAAGVDDVASSATESLVITAQAAGESFWIIADGYGAGCGVARLDVRRLEDEVCDDEVDNDGDGDVDCADPECKVNEPILCPTPPGDICGDDAIEIDALPYLDESVDTCDLAKDYEGDDLACYDYSGAEAVYRYTATSDVTLQVSVVSLDVDISGDLVDLVTNARVGCPVGGVLDACAATADDEVESPEVMDVTLTAGETVYLFVGAYYGGDCTRLSVEVNAVP